MSDFWWQVSEQDRQEYEEWLDLLESEKAIIEEEHPSMENILGRLEYLEDR